MDGWNNNVTTVMMITVPRTLINYLRGKTLEGTHCIIYDTRMGEVHIVRKVVAGDHSNSATPAVELKTSSHTLRRYS